MGFRRWKWCWGTHLQPFTPINVIILQQDKVMSVSAEVNRLDQEVTVSQHE